MVITVFGATGGLGKQVVRAALEGGHSVRAHARSPQKLEIEHERLSVIEGDLSDEASVCEALTGSEAVLSCVGFSKGQNPAVYGQGMEHIVHAMRAAHITRLVSISGAGLEFEGDASGLGRRLIILLLKLFAARVLAGKQHEWSVIRESELDWTLVRVARMVERAPSGSVEVDLHRVSGSPVVAYRDVADWMVEQTQRSEHIHAAPFVSGG